jgi:hypothetical protein
MNKQEHTIFRDASKLYRVLGFLYVIMAAITIPEIIEKKDDDDIWKPAMSLVLYTAIFIVYFLVSKSMHV